VSSDKERPLRRRSAAASRSADSRAGSTHLRIRRVCAAEGEGAAGFALAAAEAHNSRCTCSSDKLIESGLGEKAMTAEGRSPGVARRPGREQRERARAPSPSGWTTI